MFALETTRTALGPIDSPFALVESESVKRIKESRLSMMSEGWSVSETRSSEMSTLLFPCEEVEGVL